MKIKEPIRLKDAQLFLDECAKKHECVTIVALAKDGHKVELGGGWYVTSGHWTAGTHKYRSQKSGEVRQLIDVLLFQVNGHPIYI